MKCPRCGYEVKTGELRCPRCMQNLLACGGCSGNCSACLTKKEERK
ncbi:MAG: hypothetical protein ACOY3J_06870 [Bacillota bacterium]|uniref:Zinc-ribbon domain-containing protein n=1 Tax=Thermanaerosceptrum fracticalcis TaxID=1712410 RepID=A0A7G6E217_THEFR|nr:hypothetical protein [Thermanaerosceptrum fracticalcis]QNB46121.1 hypothetical protein BR63_07230 [Thermanaerosceptrum fracticalcis]